MKRVFAATLLIIFASAVFCADTSPTPGLNDTGKGIGKGTVAFLYNLKDTLTAIGPALSAILFVLAGIIYAFGQLQPADARGKYQSWSMGLIVGGFVVGALALGADTLTGIAANLLRSS